MKGSENIRAKVDRLILEQTHPLHDITKGRLKLFLGRQDFEAFVQEIEPIYKEKYGALVSEEGAAKEGYNNVLYRGVAVCFAGDPK